MRKNAEEKIVDRVREAQGTVPGGLGNPEDIRVLICYLLFHIGRALSREQLDEILVGSGLVNYFDCSQALGELCDGGQVMRDEGFFSLSPSGRRACEALQEDLPLSVRDRVLARGASILHKNDVLMQNSFEICEVDGKIGFCCDMREGDGFLMRLSAAVGSKEIAETLGRRFVNDPALLYACVFAVLSGDREALLEIAEKI